MKNENRILLEKLNRLAKQAAALNGNLQTEEATKMALVVPFFQALGYDVFNPMEFTPEFAADNGMKTGEKVDYAIILDGQVRILIEAKKTGVALDGHMAQLFKYFSACLSAKFAILTNGVEYRIYTDMVNKNLIDDKPFLEFRIDDFPERALDTLAAFRKEQFNEESAYDAAFRWKYENRILAYLKQQAVNPSDEFIQTCLEAGAGGVTRADMARLRPIVMDIMIGLMRGPESRSEPPDDVPAGSTNGDVIMWGMHCGDEGLCVDNDLIGIGWEELGDLSDYPTDFNEFKSKFRAVYQDTSAQGAGVSAGQVLKFRHVMKPGDYVVLRAGQPRVHIGRITGAYYYESGAEIYPNRRAVEWLAHVPVSEIAEDAKRELGSAMTLFRISRNVDEFLELAMNGSRDDGNATVAKRLEYWDAFLNCAFGNTETAKMLKGKTPTKRYYMDANIGVQGCHIVVRQVRKNCKLTVELYVDDKRLYEKFETRQNDISTDIGISLDWRKFSGKHAGNIVAELDVDFENHDKWIEQFAWVVDVMIRMKNVFGRYA